MKQSKALSTLAHEDRQHSISYGQLAANTTERERAEIIRAYYRDYCIEKRKRRYGK